MNLNNEKKSRKEIILSLAKNKTCDQIQATLNLIYPDDENFNTINVICCFSSNC
jgi:hypothetical protein